MDQYEAIGLIMEEYRLATEVNPPLNSGHEGYAVIREEFDELWDEIKKKKAPWDNENLKKEAARVAAMALRFLVDIVK